MPLIICKEISCERERHTPSTSSKYGSIYGSVSSFSPALKPAMAYRWIMFDSSPVTMIFSQYSALASAVGNDAYACAAYCWPFAVLSRSSSAAICSLVARPPVARRHSRFHRRSVSISRPSRVIDPSKRRCTFSYCSAVRVWLTNACTSCSCASESGSAACTSCHSLSAAYSRVSSLNWGFTNVRSAVERPSSWVRIAVEFVSCPILFSTSSTYWRAGICASRTVSHREPHTTPRATDESMSPRCFTAVSMERSSRRTFAYARSSSFSSSKSGRFFPTASVTSVSSPSISSSMRSVRVSLPSVRL